MTDQRTLNAKEQTDAEQRRQRRALKAYAVARQHLADLNAGDNQPNEPCPWAVWAVLDAFSLVGPNGDRAARQAAVLARARAIHARRCRDPRHRQPQPSSQTPAAPSA